MLTITCSTDPKDLMVIQGLPRDKSVGFTINDKMVIVGGWQALCELRDQLSQFIRAVFPEDVTRLSRISGSLTE